MVNPPSATIISVREEDLYDDCSLLTEAETQALLEYINQARTLLDRKTKDRDKSSFLQAWKWAVDVNRFEHMTTSDFFPETNCGCTFNGLSRFLFRRFQEAEAQQALEEELEEDGIEIEPKSGL